MKCDPGQVGRNSKWTLKTYFSFFKTLSLVTALIKENVCLFTVSVEIKLRGGLYINCSHWSGYFRSFTSIVTPQNNDHWLSRAYTQVKNLRSCHGIGFVSVLWFDCLDLLNKLVYTLLLYLFVALQSKIHDQKWHNFLVLPPLFLSEIFKCRLPIAERKRHQKGKRSQVFSYENFSVDKCKFFLRYFEWREFLWSEISFWGISSDFRWFLSSTYRNFFGDGQ